MLPLFSFGKADSGLESENPVPLELQLKPMQNKLVTPRKLGKGRNQASCSLTNGGDRLSMKDHPAETGFHIRCMSYNTPLISENKHEDLLLPGKNFHLTDVTEVGNTARPLQLDLRMLDLRSSASRLSKNCPLASSLHCKGLEGVIP